MRTPKMSRFSRFLPFGLLIVLFLGIWASSRMLEENVKDTSHSQAVRYLQETPLRMLLSFGHRPFIHSLIALDTLGRVSESWHISTRSGGQLKDSLFDSDEHLTPLVFTLQESQKFLHIAGLTLTFLALELKDIEGAEQLALSMRSAFPQELSVRLILAFLYQYVFAKPKEAGELYLSIAQEPDTPEWLETLGNQLINQETGEPLPAMPGPIYNMFCERLSEATPPAARQKILARCSEQRGQK